MGPIRSASRGKLNVEGRTKRDITLDSLRVPSELFVVSQIPQSANIGVNMLRIHGVRVNFKDSVLDFGGEVVSLTSNKVVTLLEG